jgi:2,4-dienoyl-CoA reductase-like NADH-dependent reductase (Old Yellow Enzyme family)
MNQMSRPWKMGTLEIKNRLVRSATDEGFATPYE